MKKVGKEKTNENKEWDKNTKERRFIVVNSVHLRIEEINRIQKKKKMKRFSPLVLRLVTFDNMSKL